MKLILVLALPGLSRSSAMSSTSGVFNSYGPETVAAIDAGAAVDFDRNELNHVDDSGVTSLIAEDGSSSSAKRQTQAAPTASDLAVAALSTINRVREGESPKITGMRDELAGLQTQLHVMGGAEGLWESDFGSKYDIGGGIKRTNSLLGEINSALPVKSSVSNNIDNMATSRSTDPLTANLDRLQNTFNLARQQQESEHNEAQQQQESQIKKGRVPDEAPSILDKIESVKQVTKKAEQSKSAADSLLSQEQAELDRMQKEIQAATAGSKAAVSGGAKARETTTAATESPATGIIQIKQDLVEKPKADTKEDEVEMKDAKKTAENKTGGAGSDKGSGTDKMAGGDHKTDKKPRVSGGEDGVSRNKVSTDASSMAAAAAAAPVVYDGSAQVGEPPLPHLVSNRVNWINHLCKSRLDIEALSPFDVFELPNYQNFADEVQKAAGKTGPMFRGHPVYWDKVAPEEQQSFAETGSNKGYFDESDSEALDGTIRMPAQSVVQAGSEAEKKQKASTTAQKDAIAAHSDQGNAAQNSQDAGSNDASSDAGSSTSDEGSTAGDTSHPSKNQESNMMKHEHYSAEAIMEEADPDANKDPRTSEIYKENHRLVPFFSCDMLRQMLLMDKYSNQTQALAQSLRHACGLDERLLYYKSLLDLQVENEMLMLYEKKALAQVEELNFYDFLGLEDPEADERRAIEFEKLQKIREKKYMEKMRKTMPLEDQEVTKGVKEITDVSEAVDIINKADGRATKKSAADEAIKPKEERDKDNYEKKTRNPSSKFIRYGERQRIHDVFKDIRLSENLQQRLLDGADGKSHTDAQGLALPDALRDEPRAVKLKEQNWQTYLACPYIDNYIRFVKKTQRKMQMGEKLVKGRWYGNDLALKIHQVMLNRRIQMKEGWLDSTYTAYYDGEAFAGPRDNLLRDVDKKRFGADNHSIKDALAPQNAGITSFLEMNAKLPVKNTQELTEQFSIDASGRTSQERHKQNDDSSFSEHDDESEEASSMLEMKSKQSESQTADEAQSESRIAASETRSEQAESEKTYAYNRSSLVETIEKRLHADFKLTSHQRNQLLMLTNMLHSALEFSPSKPVILTVVGGAYIPEDIWDPKVFSNLIVLYMHPYYRVPRVAPPLSPRSIRTAFRYKMPAMKTLNTGLKRLSGYFYRTAPLPWTQDIYNAPKPEIEQPIIDNRYQPLGVAEAQEREDAKDDVEAAKVAKARQTVKNWEAQYFKKKEPVTFVRIIQEKASKKKSKLARHSQVGHSNVYRNKKNGKRLDHHRTSHGTYGSETRKNTATKTKKAFSLMEEDADWDGKNDDDDGKSDDDDDDGYEDDEQDNDSNSSPERFQFLSRTEDVVGRIGEKIGGSAPPTFGVGVGTGSEHSSRPKVRVHKINEDGDNDGAFSSSFIENQKISQLKFDGYFDSDEVKAQINMGNDNPYEIFRRADEYFGNSGVEKVAKQKSWNTQAKTWTLPMKSYETSQKVTDEIHPIDKYARLDVDEPKIASELLLINKAAGSRVGEMKIAASAAGALNTGGRDAEAPLKESVSIGVTGSGEKKGVLPAASKDADVRGIPIDKLDTGLRKHGMTQEEEIRELKDAISSEIQYPPTYGGETGMIGETGGAKTSRKDPIHGNQQGESVVADRGEKATDEKMIWQGLIHGKAEAENTKIAAKIAKAANAEVVNELIKTQRASPITGTFSATSGSKTDDQLINSQKATNAKIEPRPVDELINARQATNVLIQTSPTGSLGGSDAGSMFESDKLDGQFLRGEASTLANAEDAARESAFFTFDTSGPTPENQAAGQKGGVTQEKRKRIMILEQLEHDIENKKKNLESQISATDYQTAQKNVTSEYKAFLDRLYGRPCTTTEAPTTEAPTTEAPTDSPTNYGANATSSSGSWSNQTSRPTTKTRPNPTSRPQSTSGPQLSRNLGVPADPLYEISLDLDGCRIDAKGVKNLARDSRTCTYPHAILCYTDHSLCRFEKNACKPLLNDPSRGCAFSPPSAKFPVSNASKNPKVYVVNSNFGGKFTDGEIIFTTKYKFRGSQHDYTGTGQILTSNGEIQVSDTNPGTYKTVGHFYKQLNGVFKRVMKSHANAHANAMEGGNSLIDINTKANQTSTDVIKTTDVGDSVAVSDSFSQVDRQLGLSNQKAVSLIQQQQAKQQEEGENKKMNGKSKKMNGKSKNSGKQFQLELEKISKSKEPLSSLLHKNNASPPAQALNTLNRLKELSRLVAKMKANEGKPSDLQEDEILRNAAELQGQTIHTGPFSEYLPKKTKAAVKDMEFIRGVASEDHGPHARLSKEVRNEVSTYRTANRLEYLADTALNQGKNRFVPEVNNRGKPFTGNVGEGLPEGYETLEMKYEREQKELADRLSKIHEEARKKQLALFFRRDPLLIRNRMAEVKTEIYLQMKEKKGENNMIRIRESSDKISEDQGNKDSIPKADEESRKGACKDSNNRRSLLRKESVPENADVKKTDGKISVIGGSISASKSRETLPGYNVDTKGHKIVAGGMGAANDTEKKAVTIESLMQTGDFDGLPVPIISRQPAIPKIIDYGHSSTGPKKVFYFDEVSTRKPQPLFPYEDFEPEDQLYYYPGNFVGVAHVKGEVLKEIDFVQAHKGGLFDTDFARREYEDKLSKHSYGEDDHQNTDHHQKMNTDILSSPLESNGLGSSLLATRPFSRWVNPKDLNLIGKLEDPDFNKARIAVTSFAHTGMTLDEEMLVFTGMDKVFDATRDVIGSAYPYPIMTPKENPVSVANIKRKDVFKNLDLKMEAIMTCQEKDPEIGLYQHDRRYDSGNPDEFPSTRNYFAESDYEDTLSEYLHVVFCHNNPNPFDLKEDTEYEKRRDLIREEYQNEYNLDGNMLKLLQSEATGKVHLQQRWFQPNPAFGPKSFPFLVNVLEFPDEESTIAKTLYQPNFRSTIRCEVAEDDKWIGGSLYVHRNQKELEMVQPHVKPQWVDSEFQAPEEIRPGLSDSLIELKNIIPPQQGPLFKTPIDVPRLIVESHRYNNENAGAKTDTQSGFHRSGNHAHEGYKSHLPMEGNRPKVQFAPDPNIDRSRADNSPDKAPFFGAEDSQVIGFMKFINDHRSVDPTSQYVGLFEATINFHAIRTGLSKQFCLWNSDLWETLMSNAFPPLQAAMFAYEKQANTTINGLPNHPNGIKKPDVTSLLQSSEDPDSSADSDLLPREQSPFLQNHKAQAAFLDELKEHLNVHEKGLLMETIITAGDANATSLSLMEGDTSVSNQGVPMMNPENRHTDEGQNVITKENAKAYRLRDFPAMYVNLTREEALRYEAYPDTRFYPNGIPILPYGARVRNLAEGKTELLEMMEYKKGARFLEEVEALLYNRETWIAMKSGDNKVDDNGVCLVF